jgi:hypothetical protein
MPLEQTFVSFYSVDNALVSVLEYVTSCASVTPYGLTLAPD